MGIRGYVRHPFRQSGLRMTTIEDGFQPAPRLRSGLKRWKDNRLDRYSTQTMQETFPAAYYYGIKTFKIMMSQPFQNDYKLDRQEK